MGLVAPWHVGSSQTRARTRVPCIGRQILNHCATREARFFIINPRFLSFLSTDTLLTARGREEDLKVGFNGPDLEAVRIPSKHILLARIFHIVKWKEARKFRTVLCPGPEGNGFDKQRPRLDRVGRPEGGALSPCYSHRPQQEEERLPFFPGKDSANEKPWNSLFTVALPTSFFPYKSVLLPLLCRDLHMTLHGCRPWISVLCWSQINPSLLEKYLAVYLFYVNPP